MAYELLLLLSHDYSPHKKSILFCWYWIKLIHWPIQHRHYTIDIWNNFPVHPNQCVHKEDWYMWSQKSWKLWNWITTCQWFDSECLNMKIIFHK